MPVGFPVCRRLARSVVAFGLLLPLPVAAQEAENVTVTGTRSREVLQGFVRSLAQPTRFTGKIARWNDGICPVVAGLPPRFTKFVGERLRDIALQAGAPVNKSPSCKPNIEIGFTAKPQALIDRLRQTNPVYLGYYDNQSQLEQLAKVTRPVQAWYATATQDLHGKVEIDSGKTIGPGLEVWLPCPQVPGICRVTLPNARAQAVTGTRLGDGLRSGLYHVTIVADPGQLKDYEMGSLADYIAFLALAQVGSLDGCQQLPSIVNMLTKDCGDRADALTGNDRAYLRGLYKMAPDMNLNVQRDQMAFQMEQDLTAGQSAVKK